MPLFKAAIDFFFPAIFFAQPLKNKKILSKLNVLRGDRIKIAFAQTQMIDRIEYIGFTLTVLTDKTIDFSIKIQLQCGLIFIMGKRNFFELHGNKYNRTIIKLK